MHNPDYGHDEPDEQALADAADAQARLTYPTRLVVSTGKRAQPVLLMQAHQPTLVERVLKAVRRGR